MNNIKIFADSTSDFSRELLERYNIDIIPLFINMDEVYYRDGVNVELSQIFKWSDETGKTPKTAAPSIEDVVDAFEPYVRQRYDIFYFAISEDMSTSANVARLAANELNYSEHVFVVDSMNLSTGIALQIIKAAQWAKEGWAAPNIYQRINDLRSRVRASFVVDTLTFLHRGGRCSATTALIGNALKLKPKIVVTEGKMDAGTKYRGNQERVIQHYVEDLREALLHAEKDRVFITHTTVARETVDQVRKYLESLHHFDEILETEAGGVISSHCGPGTLGVLFIAEE